MGVMEQRNIKNNRFKCNFQEECKMKKIAYLLLTATLLLSVTACGNTSDKDTDEEKESGSTYVDESVDVSAENDSSLEDGFLFTTEYDIEDYVENGIIVSKNDGLLYGMLDNNGNEVIPVKYDDLDFMNKDDYVEGKCENIYLIAQYEDIYTVFDIQGNEVIGDSNTDIYCINSKIKAGNDDSIPFFYSNVDEEIIFYNEKGNEISRISKAMELFECRDYVSDKWYIVYNKIYDEFTIYDYEGNIIEERDEFLYKHYIINNEYYILVSSRSFEVINGELVVDGEAVDALPGDYIYKKIKIDCDGNMTDEETYYSFDELDAKADVLSQEEKSARSYYNLYESNSTWKLEDLDGNTLYDDRYYDAFKNHSENDCVALLNENNQLLLISRTGKIYINYGILETNDGGNTMRMLYGDSSKTVKEIFEGRNSIIIPVSSSISGSYDLYYFGEK